MAFLKIMLRMKYVLTIIVVSVTSISCGSKEHEIWAHRQELDEEGEYVMYWTVKDKDIIIQLEVATKGWVGFGLSPKGLLPGSDIIIGWVKDGQGYLYDYHAVSEINVKLDSEQDWKLLSGKETKTRTILRFTRPLYLCNDGDRSITNDTQRIIFTYSPKDPESPSMVPFMQAMWTARSLKLLQPKVYKIQMPKNVFHWDIRSQNFSIPIDAPFFYHCRVYRAPSLKKKHHIIKVAPVIRPRQQDNVHHLVVYKCNFNSIAEAEEAVGYGPVRCFDESYTFFPKCNVFWAGWGIGAEALIYPNQVGLPIGGNGPEYFLLSVHYENSNFVEGGVDDSGLRFYTTPELRPFDAALLLVEVSVIGYALTVTPPGHEEVIIAGHGNPKCLAQGLPKDGIKIFAVWLHSHMKARKLRIRHFRNNKELPPIASDNNYDLHYQQYYFFSESAVVLPGDQLSMECNFDTRGRTEISLMGLATEQDMCAGFMYYYPVMSISSSISTPTPELMAGFVGMELAQRAYTDFSRIGYYNTELINSLNSYASADLETCVIENTQRFSPHKSICIHMNGTWLTIPTSTYPEPLLEYTPPDICEEKVKRKLRRSSLFESPCGERVVLNKLRRF